MFKIRIVLKSFYYIASVCNMRTVAQLEVFLIRDQGFFHIVNQIDRTNGERLIDLPCSFYQNAFDNI